MHSPPSLLSSVADMPLLLLWRSTCGCLVWLERRNDASNQGTEWVILGVIVEIVIARATTLGLAVLWVSRRPLTEQHGAGTVWLLRSDDDGTVHGARHG